MRIFTVSDVHVDYPENRKWLLSLSRQDYSDDVLILAGDISDDLDLLKDCLVSLANAFKHVCFIPGNHELWLRRGEAENSLVKLDMVLNIASETGVYTSTLCLDKVCILPLFSWYDFSFGEPDDQISQGWGDFHACRWPEGFTVADVCEHMLSLNKDPLANLESLRLSRTLITFSHFLPTIEVMPSFTWKSQSYLFPVFGSESLGQLIEEIQPTIHVYGHSHLNIDTGIHGIRYVNNAFAYPSEHHISRKCLLQLV